MASLSEMKRLYLKNGKTEKPAFQAPKMGADKMGLTKKTPKGFIEVKGYTRKVNKRAGRKR